MCFYVVCSVVSSPGLEVLWTLSGQDLYTNEEQSHVARLVMLWQEKWDEINFGQNIVKQYIRFCQYRTEFPAEFFKLVNLQIRYSGINLVKIIYKLFRHISSLEITNVFVVFVVVVVVIVVAVVVVVLLLLLFCWFIL